MMDAFIADSSYVGIFVFLVLTGLGLPLPEELVIVTSGVLCADGRLSVVFTLVALLAGCLVGDAVVYAVGMRIGDGVVRRPRPWMPKVDPARLAQMQALLARHGFKVLFAARFLVGLRFLVYLAVGASRMPFRRFMIIDTACAAFVIGAFYSLCFFLSQRYGDAIYGWVRTGEFLTTATVVVLGVAALMFVRWRRKRAIKAGPPTVG